MENLEGFWNCGENAKYIVIRPQSSGEYELIFDDWFAPDEVQYSPVETAEIEQGVYRVTGVRSNGGTKTVQIDVRQREIGRLIVDSEIYFYHGVYASYAMIANQNRAAEQLFETIGGYWNSTSDNTFYGFLYSSDGSSTVHFGHYETEHSQSGNLYEIYEYENGIRSLTVKFPEIPAGMGYSGVEAMTVYYSMDISSCNLGSLTINGEEFRYAGDTFDEAYSSYGNS